MCGIFAVIGAENAAAELYVGMVHLQHRGQDAAGMITFDFNDAENGINISKDIGLVSDIFDETALHTAGGQMGIGHTRYPTVGVGDTKEVQPFFNRYPDGIGLAFNGNIVNYPLLKEKLRKERVYLSSNSDAEVLLQIFGDSYGKAKGDGAEAVFNAAKDVHKEVIGGYSVVILIASKGVAAFRDPNGIRPLVMGEKRINGNGRKSYAFASESIALTIQGYESIRDLKPGEAVFIGKDLKAHSKVLTTGKPAPCVFEYVYFSTVESVYEGRPIYDVRKRLGEELAAKVKKRWPDMQIDVVIPVPDTSRAAANSLAKALGVPYEEGLIKNRYIGRTFIMPVQKIRENAMKLKLKPIESVIKGKNIMVVDDSIVRGTTSKRIVELLRESGAKTVCFLSTFPPIRNPCYYGIDFQRKEELIAHGKTIEEVEKELGADRLVYMDIEGLQKAVGTDQLCTACVTGEYPTTTEHAKELESLRKKHIAQITNKC
ncbi:amidophosphoribosyltransferase [Candidatus Woesearchaeota archaeon]|nr:amidophosphoribosyltransferase [Candidatus Woesearchaeota archaeon]